MDNRDDEQDIDKSASSDESHETLAGQSDAFKTPLEEAADDADNEIIEFGGTDRAGNADAEEDNESESESEGTEKDWLVDSGLAAAINPTAAIPEDTDESDEDELEDDDDWAEEDDESAESDDPDDSDDLNDLEDSDELEDQDDSDLNHETDDENDLGDSDMAESRPLWPTAVGLIAIVLLAIGGWGLYEERSTLQARIVELENSQAKARASATIDPATLSALETDNAALKLQLEGLYRDYEVAMAEITALQALAESAATADNSDNTDMTDYEEADADGSMAEDASGAPQVSPATPGDWFVNIGAYSTPASAENWLARLESAGYNAVTQQVVIDDGRVLHRVRVVGFGSKAAAQTVAQALESEFGVTELWVGQTPADA
ncbi:MAG: SPOR domain-containing protein [Halieaceae bacterium]